MYMYHVSIWHIIGIQEMAGALLSCSAPFIQQVHKPSWNLAQPELTAEESTLWLQEIKTNSLNGV